MGITRIATTTPVMKGEPTSVDGTLRSPLTLRNGMKPKCRASQVCSPTARPIRK